MFQVAKLDSSHNHKLSKSTPPAELFKTKLIKHFHFSDIPPSFLQCGRKQQKKSASVPHFSGELPHRLIKAMRSSVLSHLRQNITMSGLRGPPSSTIDPTVVNLLLFLEVTERDASILQERLSSLKMLTAKAFMS